MSPADLNTDPAAFWRLIAAQVDQILGQLSGEVASGEDYGAMQDHAMGLQDAMLATVPELLAQGLSPEAALANQIGHLSAVIVVLAERLNRLDPV